MDKRLIHHDVAFVAHDQAPEVSEPGDGAFDDPAPSVPPQGSAILGRRFDSDDFVRTDHLDAARGQSFSQRIAVVAAVEDETLRLAPPCAPPIFMLVLVPCLTRIYPDWHGCSSACSSPLPSLSRSLPRSRSLKPLTLTSMETRCVRPQEPRSYPLAPPLSVGMAATVLAKVVVALAHTTGE